MWKTENSRILHEITLAAFENIGSSSLPFAPYFPPAVTQIRFAEQSVASLLNYFNTQGSDFIKISGNRGCKEVSWNAVAAFSACLHDSQTHSDWCPWDWISLEVILGSSPPYK